MQAVIIKIANITLTFRAELPILLKQLHVWYSYSKSACPDHHLSFSPPMYIISSVPASGPFSPCQYYSLVSQSSVKWTTCHVDFTSSCCHSDIRRATYLLENLCCQHGHGNSLQARNFPLHRSCYNREHIFSAFVGDHAFILPFGMPLLSTRCYW